MNPPKPIKYPWTQELPFGRLVVDSRRVMERSTYPACTVYDVVFHPNSATLQPQLLQSGVTEDSAYSFVCGIATGVHLSEKHPA